jgi:hypothetical protein
MKVEFTPKNKEKTLRFNPGQIYVATRFHASFEEGTLAIFCRGGGGGDRMQVVGDDEFSTVPCLDFWRELQPGEKIVITGD